MNLDTVTHALNNLQIKKTQYIYHVKTSGAIPSSKVAQCMASTTYIHPNTSTKNFNGTSSLELPLTNPRNYWISVRNQQTGEEEMLQEALDKNQTKKWCEFFATSDLFRNVNLFGKFSFPKLKLPDPDTELWEQTAFKISDSHFIATVIVDPVLHLQPAYDHIHFCLVTPWLPRTYAAFQHLSTSSSRKLVLYHEAIAALLSQDNVKVIDEQMNGPPPTPAEAVAAAKKTQQVNAAAEAEIKTKASSELLNYSIATALHDHAIVDHSQWHYYKMQAGFFSSGIEKTAGAVVIEQIMSFLYPYLLILDNHTNIEYHLTQPSKFSYHFSIEKLAGCRVYGAVNMGAGSDDALLWSANNCLQKSCSIQLSPHHNGQFGQYLQHMSLHQLEQFSTYVETCIAAISNNFKALRLQAPYSNLDYPLENDDNDDIYKGETFKMKLQYMGLRLIAKQLAKVKEAKDKLENTTITDFFLRQLLQAHNKQAFSKQIDSKTWSTVVNAIVIFLHSLIEEFAANVKTAEGSLKPSSITAFLNTKVNAKSFTFEQGLGFLKSCLGTPPRMWKMNMARELNLDTNQFLKAVYYMPSILKMFFHKQLFDADNIDQFIQNKLEALVAQNPIAFEGSIFDALIKSDGYSRHADEPRLLSALVFKLFSHNIDPRGVHDWQWRD